MMHGQQNVKCVFLTLLAVVYMYPGEPRAPAMSGPHIPHTPDIEYGWISIVSFNPLGFKCWWTKYGYYVNLECKCAIMY
jgi:hypothetical protein